MAPIEIQPEWAIEEVAAGVSMAAGPDAFHRSTVNAYSLSGPGAAVLVDTAWSKGAGDEHLRELLGEPVESRTVVVTHTHRDHVGHIPSTLEWWPAPILMHEGELHTLQASDAARRIDRGGWFRSQGVPPDDAAILANSLPPPTELDLRRVRWIADGEEIELAGRRWLAMLTLGHSAGHLCLYQEEQRLLISGDQVMTAMPPGIFNRPWGPPNPIQGFLDSLQRIGRLDIETVLPGHGRPFRLTAAILRGLGDFELARVETARAVLAAEPSTAFQLAERIRWRGGLGLAALAPIDRSIAVTNVVWRMQYLSASGGVHSVELDDGAMAWTLS